MKNFTGKVTDVDNNGNPIKKKSGGKNGKKSGFKKPTAAKKSSGKKPLKDIAVVMTKKPVRKIVPGLTCEPYADTMRGDSGNGVARC